MKIIMIGAPGSGKGTQAAVISKKYGIPAISTGDILRAAIKEGTPIGVLAKSLIDKGQLVPDEVMIDIVNERLAQDDCSKGYILDGMPRTMAQAEALESASVEIDVVIFLEISDAEVERRMVGRRVCPKCGATHHVDGTPSAGEPTCDVCGERLIVRDDDDPETVRARLKIYHNQTEQLKDFYLAKGLLYSVNGCEEVETISEKIFAILENRR